jgi:cytochrome c biogenesis protein CcdA
VVIAYGLILLGVLFIVSRFRPLPYLSFAPAGAGQGETHRTYSSSALAMGAIFGLDVPACTSPLVLALLAETVLVGNYLFGAVALFIFGVAMSLPLLVLGAYEGANRWLLNVARRYGTAFYLAAGGLLILVGVAELSPTVMSLVGGWVRFIVEPFLTG